MPSEQFAGLRVCGQAACALDAPRRRCFYIRTYVNSCPRPMRRYYFTAGSS